VHNTSPLPLCLMSEADRSKRCRHHWILSRHVFSLIRSSPSSSSVTGAPPPPWKPPRLHLPTPPSPSTRFSGEPPPLPPCQVCSPCLPGAHAASPATPCLPVSLGRLRHHDRAVRSDHAGECLGCWARPNRRSWVESRPITVQLFSNSFSFL
jgi:hypothetical protein